MSPHGDIVKMLSIGDIAAVSPSGDITLKGPLTGAHAPSVHPTFGVGPNPNNPLVFAQRKGERGQTSKPNNPTKEPLHR